MLKNYTKLSAIIILLLIGISKVEAQEGLPIYMTDEELQQMPFINHDYIHIGF